MWDKYMSGGGSTGGGAPGGFYVEDAVDAPAIDDGDHTVDSAAATNLMAATELDKKTSHSHAESAHNAHKTEDSKSRQQHSKEKADGRKPEPHHADSKSTDRKDSKDHSTKRKTQPPTPTAAERAATTELTRCYQVGCNMQVGAAGGKSEALTCLSSATSKEAGAKCLGPENPKSPSNALRTCMICHKCINGHLNNPKDCDAQSTSWNNGGSSWIG
jgi:hypothetical protein